MELKLNEIYEALDVKNEVFGSAHIAYLEGIKCTYNYIIKKLEQSSFTVTEIKKGWPSKGNMYLNLNSPWTLVENLRELRSKDKKDN